MVADERDLIVSDSERLALSELEADPVHGPTDNENAQRTGAEPPDERGVQEGIDPMAVVRDADHPVIDTGLGENLETRIFNEIYRVTNHDRGKVEAGQLQPYQRYDKLAIAKEEAL